MSDGQNDDLTGEEKETDTGEDLEVTLHYAAYAAECFDPNEPGYFGLILRRNQGGDIIPGSVTATLLDEDSLFESAIAAGADAQGRRRIPPERPPRSPQPIQTWDELVDMSPRERERRAVEIASRPEFDNERDRSTWPNNWGTHHLLPLDAVFCFDPAISEAFVAARLSGINAYKQMTFLRKYLPGEIHSLQRAETRGVTYEANISHPDVHMRIQKLDATQTTPGNSDYIEPVLPCWAPPNWSRFDDAFAALYLGDDPVVFRREYSWAPDDIPSVEFLRIRMAQIPHLNLNWMELEAAKCRRNFLINADPGDYPIGDSNMPDSEHPEDLGFPFF